MTAIVGVLNKRAAVMAADSAVTVTNGNKRKIYNTATKIFKLSEEYPVGVMIYNAVEFMETPWDVIIKMYAKKRGNQCFDHLAEYVDDFIDFLKTAPVYVEPETANHTYLQREMCSYYEDIKQKVTDRITEEYEANPEAYQDEEELNALARKLVTEEIAKNSKEFEEVDVCSEFEDYSLNVFCNYAMEEFNLLMKQCKEDDIPASTRYDWEKGLYAHIIHEVMYNYTGLVFVGYGEKEIFPSMFPVNISGFIDGRLRYYLSENQVVQISNDRVAELMPFAQYDVIQTIMRGVAPELYDFIRYSYMESMEEQKEMLIKIAKENDAPGTLLQKMHEMDSEEMYKKFDEDILKFVRKSYVDGIIDALDSFNIEDMGNLAESLISITNLQRHITSSEESVGGPVDVAVITRSDGFVWLKHKNELS